MQRKRIKGFRLVSPTGLPIVYVGRPTKWGNPYKAGEVRWTVHNIHKAISQEEAVELYEDLVKRGDMPQIIKKELKGKNLSCWCSIKDKNGKIVPCHAAILLSMANK